MNKGTRLTKRLVALFLVLLLSIESFGAVVSDNDGSAFITKAEFDSLKNDFQSQLDAYNSSIDSKIDSAIASYLAGLQISTDMMGENYIKRLGTVRFFSESTVLNATHIDDVRYGYQVRAFGSMTAIVGYQLRSANALTGSWLYSSDGEHYRSGIFKYGGEENNYYYLVDKIDLNGTTYYYLTDNTSKNVIHYFGAYGSYWGSALDFGNSRTNYVTFAPYDLDLSSYTTNVVDPWTYTWSQVGSPTKNAHGQKFNVWTKKDNTTDTVNPYFDFTNKQIDTSKSLYVFTENDFQNFTIQKTFECEHWYGCDAWLNVHNAYDQSNTIDGWAEWRAYSGIEGGWHPAPRHVVIANLPESNVTYVEGTPKVKYMMPKFTNLDSGNLVNGAATNLIKKPVYPYYGVPLTIVLKNAKQLKINFTIKAYKIEDEAYQNNKPYYVIIRNTPFPNTDTSTLLSSLTDGYYMEHITDGQNDIELKIGTGVLDNWNEDDTLYLRVLIEDENCYANVECSDIMWTIQND